MIKQLKGAVADGFTRYARNATRKQLLNMSDHVLEDFGLSREALLSGNDAFPWHTESDWRQGQQASVQAPSAAVARHAMPEPMHEIDTADVLSMTLATAVLAPRAQPFRRAA